MQFDQSVLILAPLDRVWLFIRDVPLAAECLPGVEDVEVIGEGRYKGKMRVRVGPVTVDIEGTMALTEEDRESNRAAMEVEGTSRRVGGGVRGTLAMKLTEPSPGQTELHIVANISFLGRIGELGQPLVKRKADSLFREFASNLSQRIT